MILLGIDVGGTGIKGALVDSATGRLRSRRHRIDTPKPATPEAVGQVVAQIVAQFDYDGPIGVAFPSRVKDGVVLTATNIDDAWLGAHGAAVLRNATGLPVCMINDADAAGVAEMAFGVGRGRRDFVVLLTFGTGIGSALFYKGMLVPNTEFGHFELHGKNAERFAADSARKRYGLTWEQWALRVQDYLSHLEFLLHPDLIILGGGISRPQKLNLYFHLLKTDAELVPAKLQNEAGIVGAACAAKELVGT